MDNSLATHLSAYVEAMFKDVAYAYTKPSDRRRDQTRLLHELAIHGSRVLTLDLPALLKHLDRCLDEGHYTRSMLRYGAAKRGYNTPILFGNLYLKVFDAEGKLRVSPCVSSIFCLRTLLGSCKKLELPCKPGRIIDEIQNFIDIEEGIRSPTLSWRATLLDHADIALSFRDELIGSDGKPSGNAHELSRSSARLGILQAICDRVSTQFGDLHNEGISELPKHGPGVVSNQKRGTSKYVFRFWPDKLQAVFPYDLYATTNLGVGYDHDREVLWEEWETIETPSRLIAVPKTQKAPRLIAAEAVEHQWIQQLIMRQLECRMVNTHLRHCIDFRSQRRNRVLAKQGSKDGSLATVDLSSASDRLSLWVVERAFRRNYTLLERLHASRSRWVTSGIRQYGSRSIEMRKFAPMGSAVTFPVQSIVYACMAIASVLVSEGLTSTRRLSSRRIDNAARRVRVFGDDIIVPTTALGDLREYLAFAGLKVNTDKTFGKGKFRESCGIDAYDGYDVSIPYLKSPSSKVSNTNFGSVLDVSNNYFRKGFWHVADWLRSLADPHWDRLPVVAYATQPAINDSEDLYREGGLPGWESFSGELLSRLPHRWNAKLQREEVRIFTPTGKKTTLPTNGSYRLFQWFIEKPRPDTKWSSGTTGKVVSVWRRGWAPVGYYDEAP